MSFYNASDSKFTRHYREEVDMVFSGLDCVLHGEYVIYASSELTSGRRLYELLREHGCKTADELKEKLGNAWYKENVLTANVNSAVRFAETIRGKFHDNTLVITPAPFTAAGWSQAEYLAFWEELLRTRVKTVWFNSDWQFSNGCTFEFVVAEDAGLLTFDHQGFPLGRKAGIALIEGAIHALAAQGLDTSKLRENLERLLALAAPVNEVSA
jgi:hypothetical protein